MKEIFMSKLIDFYKYAESDESLRLELEAANRNFAEKEAAKPGSVDQESVIAEAIRLAGNHGVTLEKADFELQKDELDEAELNVAVGGIKNTGPNKGFTSSGSPGSNPYDRICLFLMG
jgi:hypothetical protein